MSLPLLCNYFSLIYHHRLCPVWFHDDLVNCQGLILELLIAY